MPGLLGKILHASVRLINEEVILGRWILILLSDLCNGEYEYDTSYISFLLWLVLFFHECYLVG